jgi:hypothetical protein
MINSKEVPRLPNKVFKFRTWKDNYHKRMLQHNELFLASPSSLNDPFDCRIPPDFIHLSPEGRIKYANDLIIKFYPEIENRGLNVQKQMKRVDDKLSNPQACQREMEEIKYSMEDEAYGIFSVSTVWNNILLWSHYADFHGGICIGFWTKKLISTNSFGRYGKIDYKNNFPHIEPRVPRNPYESIEEAFIQTHTKAKDWKYEKEFRFVTTFEQGIPSKREIIIENGVFAEVILGIKIDESDKTEILSICTRKKIPVYQAKRVDFKFKLLRERII